MKKTALAISVAAILVAGCSGGRSGSAKVEEYEGIGEVKVEVRKPDNDHCALDTVVYVKLFQFQTNLKDYEEVPIDLIGVQDIRIDGKHIWFSGNTVGGKQIAAYDKHNYTLAGSFLAKGNGPNENTQMFPPYLTDFYTKDGRSFLNFDNGRQTLCTIDLTESLEQGTACIVRTAELPKGNIFFALNISDESLYYTSINKRFTGVNRTIFKDGESSTLPVMDRLNSHEAGSSEDGMRFNMFSVFPAYNEPSNTIVEVPVYLNGIHLYSLDGNVAKTICVDEKLTAISSLDNDNFRFAKDFCTDFKYNELGFYFLREKTLYFFDWSGLAILKMTVPVKANAFDFDVYEEKLYMLDTEKEKLYLFNLSGIRG